ncbi:MAG: radical SAM protein [Proteobacteria bacterium]|nr:radical SAM protein [Pseudomonadota bacterium]
MNVLLINLQNSGSRLGYAGLFFPFGMAYISAVLKKHGLVVDCLDLHTEKILQEEAFNSWAEVSRFDIAKYDIVAFGGTFLKFEELKHLSEKIYQTNNNIFQVAGGNMATIISEIILRQTRVNCVCLYEGEETIIELLNLIKNNKNWRETKSINYLDERHELVQTPLRDKIKLLDSIPFPDRSGWSFGLIRRAFPYGSPGRYCAIMFASRGCPFTCIFCNPISGRIVRSRSSENIVEEIIFLKNNWNIRYFRFFDEVFIGSKQKIKNLCELMIKEKLDVFWWCQTQIKFVDEELLRLMKRAGCIEIGYGIESGSNIILTEMNKGITKKLAKEVVEMTNRVGIKPSLNLITGTPSETPQTLQETKEFLISLNHIKWSQVPTIDFIIPIPNTKLYTIAKEKGFLKNEEKYLTEDMFMMDKYSKTINLTQMPDKDFFDLVAQCNNEVRVDFLRKHPFKRLSSLLGLDHLRMGLIFRNFSLSQIVPLTEALLYATLGKKKNILGKWVLCWIYRRQDGRSARS